MWDKFKIQSIVSKKHPLPALFLGVSMLVSNGAYALTANDVMNKMNQVERRNYISGVIGGFAYSRYLRDRPDKTGMNCIYDWFYNSGDSKWSKFDTWLSRHLDKPVEPLLYVLVKRKCGK